MLFICFSNNVISEFESEFELFRWGGLFHIINSNREKAVGVSNSKVFNQ